VRGGGENVRFVDGSSEDGWRLSVFCEQSVAVGVIVLRSAWELAGDNCRPGYWTTAQFRYDYRHTMNLLLVPLP
jgi:hypothetical protein